jgi:hypothetical protein
MPVRLKAASWEPEMPRPSAALNPAIEPPPLLMNEAAASLNVSRRWFQGFLRTIPPCWLAAGNRKLFDMKTLECIKEEMRRRARSSVSFEPYRRAKRFTAPAASPSVSAVLEAIELAKRSKRGLPRKL